MAWCGQAGQSTGALQLLTWNLFHGRAVPGARRDLHAEFAHALSGWSWDVALLQEVPPWWPAALAEACDAVAGSVLTSRNGALALRRAIAVRLPDLIKSNGGGANAILVRRAFAAISAERSALLCRLPERRRLHAVLAGGIWIGNLHASTDPGAAARDIARARATLLAWAGEAPAVLGGDFNVRAPAVPGFAHAGGDGVDHVLTRGAAGAGAELLDAGPLSDHRPLRVRLELS